MWSCFASSCYNLVAITFVQYFEIVHPIFHKAHKNKMKPRFIICLTWATSLIYNILFSVPSSYIVDGICMMNGLLYANLVVSSISGVAMILFFIIIPISLMIGCFCHMAHTLHKRTRRIEPANSPSLFYIAKMNILKTLIFFMTTIVLCWTCCNSVFFLSFINAIDNSFYETWLYHFFILLLFLSCSINPFIYAVNYKKFRNGFIRLLRSHNRRTKVFTVNSSGTKTMTNII